MKLLVEANNILSLITGSSRDSAGMKDRVRRRYEGEFTDHVHGYDEHGFHLQDKSARIQLAHLSFVNMNVLDVGCGTGALGYAAIDQGAKSVVCGDISYSMLKAVMAKNQLSAVKLLNSQLDAEDLPFKDDSFDSVISGMVFGTLPDQERVVEEMVRVPDREGLFAWGPMVPSTIGRRLTQHSAASISGTSLAIVSNGGQEAKLTSKGFSKMQGLSVSRAGERFGEINLMMAPLLMTFLRPFHPHGGMQNSHPKKGEKIPIEPEIISCETILM